KLGERSWRVRVRQCRMLMSRSDCNRAMPLCASFSKPPKRRPSQHSGNGGRALKLNYLTMTIIVAFAVVFAINLQRFPLTVTRAAGLGIAIPSFILFMVARIQLGRAFSVKAKATTLVTTGIYSRIRNPIYVFGVLMVAGVIIWTN